MNSIKIKLIKSLLLFFILFYGLLFVVTFFSPQTIEKRAGSFIAQEVSKRTHEHIDSIGSHKIFNSKIIQFAKEKMLKEKEKIKSIKEMLHQKADEKLASVMAKMNNLDCECRKKYQKIFHKILIDIRLSVEKRVKQIESFMSQSYMVVMQKLLDDFKIFVGSNFISLFVLFLLFQYKPKYEKVFLWLSIFMLVSTVVCSYFYIFNQNWFFTLIFNDFIGYGYLAYLLALFSFFVDIVFNKARITQVILDAIGSIFSSVGSAC